MDYIIHNVMDSDFNLFGLKYVVMVVEPLENESISPKKILVCESDQKRILEKKIFEAAYSSDFSHKSALASALVWIMEDSIKRGSLNVSRIQFKVPERVKAGI